MSRVRVVHNVAKGPKVDVSVDESAVLRDVPYKANSNYLEVPDGYHKLSIEAGGNKLAEETVDLESGKDYTVIAHGDINDLSTISLLALEDNNSCPARGKSHLRFVHAAAGAPSVDIYAAKDSNVGKIFNNVSYGNLGKPNYLPVDSAKYNVGVSVSGKNDLVLRKDNLGLEKGKVYTVVATGIPGDNDAPLDALVLEDNFCPTVLRHHGRHGRRHHRY